MVVSALRTCIACGQEKTLFKFYKDCYGPGGRMMVCKSCHDVTVKNIPPKKRRRAVAETVTCPKCGESKLREEFSKNKRNKNGLQTYCRLCHRSMTKTSYENRKAQTQREVVKLKKCTKCNKLLEETKENFYFKKNGKARSSCKACYLADEKNKRDNKPQRSFDATRPIADEVGPAARKKQKTPPRQGAERKSAAVAAWNSIQTKQEKLEMTPDEFYQWWLNEPDSCYYCGISEQQESERQSLICEYEGDNEQLLAAKSAAKRMNYPQRLTTDRKNSFGKYSLDNIVKCCSFCNAAKSNCFTEEEFLAIGAEKKVKIQDAVMQEKNKVMVSQINVKQEEALHIELRAMYRLRDKGIDVSCEILRIEEMLSDINSRTEVNSPPVLKKLDTSLIH